MVFRVRPEFGSCLKFTMLNDANQQTLTPELVGPLFFYFKETPLLTIDITPNLRYLWRSQWISIYAVYARLLHSSHGQILVQHLYISHINQPVNKDYQYVCGRAFLSNENTLSEALYPGLYDSQLRECLVQHTLNKWTPFSAIDMIMRLFAILKPWPKRFFMRFQLSEEAYHPSATNV